MDPSHQGIYPISNLDPLAPRDLEKVWGGWAILLPPNHLGWHRLNATLLIGPGKINLDLKDGPNNNLIHNREVEDKWAVINQIGNIHPDQDGIASKKKLVCVYSGMIILGERVREGAEGGHAQMNGGS
ncbi:hypothetical protein DSO57_1009698 [Entomophthora muscae]|uniref:Uncharacterized protein n=1 Tax=Entomophthora muscae TaxID=34485 RepID=A0ACC2THS7_9FUNG|nr:hypothetical protein DSO57_1009698 [Entomophthora muscae]